MVGGDFIPRGIWLEQVAMVQGRLIAIDWHQVTDVGRSSADILGVGTCKLLTMDKVQPT